ncbi:uncharacterized protein LOC105639575 isoform X3 [Jatropha curcas]|uniref:uncharacterized protein LOC105639575 isoform X3 n=1 Tax=Jatropha curcas TaxID=180498 RepID=UPI0005FB896C|nr:uncharacterized protein LOC105639575 isoform X3 [Jatropha curcas]
MISMDLKGISWVGNIYQKFEAMCLEVEEIMYQDTVKYVENQVQTVGSGVKKLYSDVMQDLLPPSSEDATKGAVSDLPLELYADVGFYVKPKVGMKEKHVEVDDMEKLTEDAKMATAYNFGHPPPFQRLSRTDNLFPLSERDSAGGASKQYDKGSLSDKSNLSIKKISKRKNVPLNEKIGAIIPLEKDLTKPSSFREASYENHLGYSAGGASKRYGEGYLSSNLGINRNSERESMSPDEKSRLSTPLDKDLTRISSFFELSNENQKAPLYQSTKITTSESVEVREHDIIEEESKSGIENANELMPDIPARGSTSDMVNVIESGMRKEMDMRPSSCGSSLAEANATDVCSNHRVVPLVEACANGEVQRSKIASEEDFDSNSGLLDDQSKDVNEVETSLENELEIIQNVDKIKLEESCIMVNGDEFNFVPRVEGKSKSYKIQDVFSPRKRSMRKHEYEQLAIWPGNDSNSNQKDFAKISIPSLTINDTKKSLSTPDFCESEWELL